ncbi:hypothetical protein DFQ27_009675 [Actinomortierella ambigua]|uniref:ATP-dependent (S)-NAD(P)H-hydrate dehydratase n=1 Tax=Actinomortierella ambigua TaxID=1343610 RepID=A0A9P6QGB2_9FUNG|nr:hypothetical protein DFQ27_009675 [Actinomortierella ambigua]
MTDPKLIQPDPSVYRAIVPPLTNNLHKGQGGRIGILGGSSDYTGAPYFSGMSALRLGADLCHIICDEDAATAIKSYSPDLIVHPFIRVRAMRAASNLSAKDHIESQGMHEIELLLKRIHVLVVGPGLSRDKLMLGVARYTIQEARKLNLPIIIDADGLILIQDNPEVIQGYHRAVLTPNVVEFKRLCESQSIDTKKEDVDNPPVLQLSRKLGVVVVEKGKEDYISDGTKVMVVSNEGGLKRSGGQGDILTGLMATSLAWGIAYNNHEWQTGHHPSDNDTFLTACAGACALTRECSRRAFQKHRRALQSSDVVEEIGPLFDRFYEENEPIPEWGKQTKASRVQRSANNKEAKEQSTRWRLPCHRQKHDDRPHQDAVMAAMPELCTMIAEYLTTDELTMLVQVCQEWHNYWTGYLYRRVTLNKHTIAIGIGKLRFDLYGAYVETLSFANCDDSDVTKVFQHDFPNLRTVDLTKHAFTSSKTFNGALKSMPSHLRQLSLFCFPSNYGARTFQQEIWTTLSSLHKLFPELEKLKLVGYSYNGFGLLMLLLRNMTRLRVLELPPDGNHYYSYRTLAPQNKFAHLGFDHHLDWTHPTLERLDLSLFMICEIPKLQSSGNGKDDDENNNNNELSTPLGRLHTFFRRIPKLRRLHIHNFDATISVSHWREGVLSHLSQLEFLSLNVLPTIAYSLSEKLDTLCPKLTSLHLYRPLSPHAAPWGTTLSSPIDQLPPALVQLTLSSVNLTEETLTDFVERSSPRALRSSVAATSNARLLPIPPPPLPSSSLVSMVPADTLCHTLRRLNLESARGLTEKAMLTVLDHCSRLEALNIIDTGVGSLALFEDGRPWACAETLKALAMDLIRTERSIAEDNMTISMAALAGLAAASAAMSTAANILGNGGGNGGNVGGGGGGLTSTATAVLGAGSLGVQFLQTTTATTAAVAGTAVPAGYPYELFSVHDLRRIRRRLLSLVRLRALRLRGSLARLAVISRGDYKPRNELASTDLRAREGPSKQKQKQTQTQRRRRRTEVDDEDMEDAEKEEEEVEEEEEDDDDADDDDDDEDEEELELDDDDDDDDGDDDDIELRRQRNASILDQLVWAKIDIELYDIFEERAGRLQIINGGGGDVAAGGSVGVGGGPGTVGVGGPMFGFRHHIHGNQSQLTKESATLEHWQAHHHDMENVWYDYFSPRGQIKEMFQFRKDSTTGWMAANLASEDPFSL